MIEIGLWLLSLVPFSYDALNTSIEIMEIGMVLRKGQSTST
jgi:hypothetical protein